MSRRKVVAVKSGQGSGVRGQRKPREKKARAQPKRPAVVVVPAEAKVSQETILKEHLGEALKSGRHLVLVAWVADGQLRLSQTHGRFPIGDLPAVNEFLAREVK